MRLYFRYFLIHLKSVMQYKVSFFLTLFTRAFISFGEVLSIKFMFQRFHTVDGFTYSDVLLCYATMLLSFSIAECFARGFDTFSSMIGNGEFDRVLVRPRNEILQVLGTKIEFTRLGRALTAVILFAYAISNGNVSWDVTRVLTLIFMVVGGTAVFSGLFLIYATLCFFTLEGLEFINIFTDGMREHGRYPLSIYGKRVMQICTYIIPFTLIQYYPLMYILDKGGSVYCMFLPLIAILFLLPCWLLWRFGVHKYKSTGS